MNLAIETAAYTSATRKFAPVRVVRRESLLLEADGPRRGAAHAGFEGIPKDAPGFLDYGPLLMVAEGEMRPGECFPMHAHDNLDDVQIMRTGRLRHADSLGNERVLNGGEMSFLAAGEHMEHLAEVHGDEAVQCVLFFVRPDTLDGPSAWYHRELDVYQEPADWTPIASGRPHSAAPPLRADVEISRAVLKAGQRVGYQLFAGRRGYLIALDGRATLSGHALQPGDRALLDGSGAVEVVAEDDVEIYLVDLPQS